MAQNDAGTHGAAWHKADTAHSRNVKGLKNENPGALAGATGADFEVGNFKGEPYRNPGVSSNRKSESALSRFMQARHKRMSRVLGYCLTLDTPEGWRDFSLIAMARMSPRERVSLAFAALNTLETDVAELTAAAVTGAAGDPLPAFLGGMEGARSWAAWASRSELKAYALACFEAMAPKDRAAFYRRIGTVEVAA